MKNFPRKKNTPTKSLDEIKEKALREARAVAPKYCEKCGTKYEDHNYHLVKKDGNQSVFHLKCEKCSNTYILNIVSPGPNILASQRSSLNIDLNSPEEMSKFAGRKPISKDEVIDIYNLLNTEKIEDLLK